MKTVKLTPKEKALSKIDVLLNIVNDNFANCNPYSLTAKDWQNYKNTIDRIKIAKSYLTMM